MTNTASFGEISTQISKIVGDKGLNLLINNAGVTTKFTKLALVKTEQLLENLTVNTIAPIMLTKVQSKFNFFNCLKCRSFYRANIMKSLYLLIYCLLEFHLYLLIPNSDMSRYRNMQRRIRQSLLPEVRGAYETFRNPAIETAGNPS